MVEGDKQRLLTAIKVLWHFPESEMEERALGELEARIERTDREYISEVWDEELNPRTDDL